LLGSSNSFKECVTAHWSSDLARKIIGHKWYTEARNCIYEYTVVGEHSCASEVES
jgi:hypothetical protein